MLIRDEKGNELLEIIDVPEGRADELYRPVTHALGVVKAGAFGPGMDLSGADALEAGSGFL